MLTGLYVPANRPDRFAKAVAAGPDLVVFDLEDAVPVDDKAGARGWAVAWIAANAHGPVEIRVNALGSPWIEDDLAAISSVPPQEGGLAVASRPDAVADLQTRRSFGWQAMPLFLRLVALAKCGSLNGPAPEQFVLVLAIA